MRQTLALAALGEGTTHPNPRVGCVIVRDERVVGHGYHTAAGGAHAEAMAIAHAGRSARNATLYVNLEPCAHRGLTPPCDRLLVQSGIRRVVAAIGDPNPLVNGRGFANLRDAGIQVQVGVLADEAERLNAAFLHWHRTGRPYVTLKAAISSDGRISARDGVSQWITGAPARRFAHRLRLRNDATLVGAGTVRADNPRLDVRLPGVRAPRRRVVISRSLDLDTDSHLLAPVEARAVPTRVYTGADQTARSCGHAEVVRVASTQQELDLSAVLDDLGRLGVQSLLVEGGGRTHASFLTAGWVQRVILFVSPKLIGARGATPVLDIAACDSPDRAWSIAVERSMVLGQDRVLEGSLRAPVEATQSPADT